MRHIIHKWFFAWNYEKEEKWLNDMSSKGLQLVSVGFCKYIFEEGKRGEYQYKLELLENWPTHPESTAYIRFLEETGVEYIGPFLRWAYFRKKADSGSFELYSDINSRIRHYNRVRLLFAAVMPVNVANAVSMLNRFSESGEPSFLIICIISTLISLLLGYGLYTITSKVRKLKKEKVIRE